MDKALKFAPPVVSALRPGDIVVGTLADIAPTGQPIVQIPGVSQRVPATTLVQFEAATTPAERLLGQPVLVQVITSDPWSLVVLGVPSESIWRESETERKRALPPTEPVHAAINGETIRLAAGKEIELVCGSSAIVLRSDGSVIVRGVNVTSRAKKSNKIRGAAVNIN